MNRTSLCIGSLAVLLLVVGCDQFQDAAKAPPPAPVANSAPATINPQLIEIFDGEMRKSSAFRLSGDLRPIWIVSGRIRNNSSSELGHVTVRINVTGKATSDQFDGATLKIDTDIPPGSVGSFTRDIQIMPPTVPWAWSYDIVKAVPK